MEFLFKIGILVAAVIAIEVVFISIGAFVTAMCIPDRYRYQYMSDMMLEEYLKKYALPTYIILNLICVGMLIDHPGFVNDLLLNL